MLKSLATAFALTTAFDSPGEPLFPVISITDSNWSIVTRVNPQVAALDTLAVLPYQDGGAAVVSCRRGELMLIIIPTWDIPKGRHTLELELDKDGAETVQGLSDGNAVLVEVENQWSVNTFLSRMAGSFTMKFSESGRSATYNIEGADAAIQAVADQCPGRGQRSYTPWVTPETTEDTQ